MELTEGGVDVFECADCGSVGLGDGVGTGMTR